MDIDRLVCIIAANPTRDLEAEDALTRALARNGGDGLTTCKQDAGLCPKPCLRHRRVNVGIWPSWRCVHVEWPIKGGRLCRSQEFANRYPFNTYGTYQDHIDREKKKAWLADLVKRHQMGEPVALWNMTGDEFARQPPVFWSNTPSIGTDDLVALFNLQAEDLLRQARNISDNMGISPLWNREPDIIIPPDTTWYAQYPEQVWNERSHPQWTVTSPEPRPFEGKTYRFDPISITVPLPAESPQPSASHQSLLAAAIPPPAPDSEA